MNHTSSIIRPTSQNLVVVKFVYEAVFAPIFNNLSVSPNSVFKKPINRHVNNRGSVGRDTPQRLENPITVGKLKSPLGIFLILMTKYVNFRGWDFEILGCVFIVKKIFYIKLISEQNCC